MNRVDGGWGGEDAWKNILGNVRDVVRQELVTTQLDEHLPSPDADLRVLDVGCGQGTQLLQLARKGYNVTGIDISPKLLASARASLAQEKPEVQERVQILEGNIHELDQLPEQNFDLVACHGVLMYLPSLEQSVEELAAVVAPGGLISLLTRNRASIAMRAGMMGDWQGAIDGFDARNYNNRVGVTGTRADEPEEVIGALGQHGINLVQWYGVRLFTDHWGDVKPGDDFSELLAAEEQAGKRDPYRQLTSLTHVIGQKSN